MYKQARVLGASVSLFLLSLVFTAFSVRHPEVGQIGARVYLALTSPFHMLLENVWSKSSGVWGHYIWLVDTVHKNEELKEQLAELRSELVRLKELPVENASLREVLSLKADTGFEGVIASVVGYDPAGWVRSVTVNRGGLDGVQTRMPVIQGGSVVGQVSAAAPHTSQVLLLTDRSSGIAALAQRSRARGVVVGLSTDLCSMEFVQEDEDVLVGDIIISSGMDGIFPKGLQIGQ
ncbi:MAG: rod shape-determining protein MreC, partial [Bdellovibrionales bacterium]|nr:rod shape-determining protein MreC [Bdellovibrionales bacterium]